MHPCNSFLGRAAVLLLALLAAGSPLLAQAGNISTVAGTGAYGYSGDNGPAASAQLDVVCALAADSQGNVYLADSWSQRVRKIAANGIITTVAGTGAIGYSGDGGPAISAQLAYPRGLAVDAQGNLYISDSGNSRIRKVAVDGKISTIAGTGEAGYSGDNGPAAEAKLRYPRGLAVDSAGTLYVADSWNYRVRKIAQGNISTVAGNGAYGASGDGAQATDASLGVVQALALDRQGNLYVSDVYNHSVRKISATGVISTVIGGGFGSGGDGGAAQSAQLSYPRGLVADSHGNLYVVDAGNHRVRVVDSAGNITTVAGVGTPGYSGDGGQPVAAQLNNPYDVALDSSGALVVADIRNYRLRKVVPGAVAPPVLATSAGVQNAATFAPPAAPGMLATIWGQRLAAGAAAASTKPLPTSLLNTSVMVDGTAIPLLYVSAGQINAQLPGNLSLSTHALKVVAVGVESSPMEFEVAAASPGIYQGYGTTQGAVLNQDFSVNSAANPADRGSWIMIYANGQGAVNPAVADGVAAPGDPLSWTPAMPAVYIGGKQASDLYFSGLAPSFVGLWQINVKVPADAPTGGAVDLQISLGGAASNTVSIGIK